MNRTLSRVRLVKFLSLKTAEGSNNYPCNTVSGPRAGEPCAFPYFYPDCNLTKKVSMCQSEPEISRTEYRGCYNKANTDTPWCYTKTYHNRSHIIGEWGYCSSGCTGPTVRSVFSFIYTSRSSKSDVCAHCSMWSCVLFYCGLRSFITILISSDPQYNLASEVYTARWEEGVYRLYETGHCHTFNPENVSLSGLQGQHYLNLGLCLEQLII